MNPQNIRRYRRASIWLRFAATAVLMQGLFGNCNPGTITTTTTTELDTTTVLQSLFRSILVEPVVAFINERIETGINSIFGTNDA